MLGVDSAPPFSGGGHQRREALKNFFELFSKRG